MSAVSDEAAMDEKSMRHHGLRVTKARKAVLSAVSAGSHATVQEIHERVTATIGDTSLQAIYDVLHALTNAGLLAMIEPAGHPTRYERRVGDNHHHIVCRHCGALDDVDCATGEAPCLIPKSTHGFTLVQAEVTYWGLCPRCAMDTRIKQETETTTPGDFIS